MRQVWITRRGGPEVLEVRETPDPTPDRGQVRIRVRAVGVNFADVLIRIGLYPDAPTLPAVIGYEVAGEIDAVGERVEDVAVGSRVVALLPYYGGYGEYAVVPSREAVPIPDGLSFEKAAAVPVNYLTAWMMLVRLGHLRDGEDVLIHSAAGGVGQAAVQIARWRGARILGTASAAKHERLAASGVACCIDYRSQDFEREVLRFTNGRGVDLVLDAIGGRSFAKSYRCLAPLGRLFVYGVAGMVAGRRRNLVRAIGELFRMPRFNPLKMLEESRGVVGFTLGSLKDEVEPRREVLSEILELVGPHFDPVVDRTFTFDQAGEAHEYLQGRRNFGKVLLVP